MFETTWEIVEEDSCYDFYDNKIDPLIQKILIQRGIKEEEEMYEFLSSKPQKTYDPFLMKNMVAVVKRIVKYIKEQKSIWIYGDYDVGATRF